MESKISSKAGVGPPPFGFQPTCEGLNVKDSTVLGDHFSMDCHGVLVGFL